MHLQPLKILFYKHNGIMPKALLRAMLQDITNSNQSSGGRLSRKVLSNKNFIVVKQMKLSYTGRKFIIKDEKSYIRI